MYIQQPIIIDNFCPQIDEVRQSFLTAGFGTWEPGHGKLGVGKFEGVGYVGEHKYMNLVLTRVMNGPIISGSQFARINKEGDPAAYIHSDRTDGQRTAISYLSHEKDENHGTGFYRLKPCDAFPEGLDEMPCYQTQDAMGTKGKWLQSSMLRSSPEEWELTLFVPGAYNRCVIFHAPLFHSRLPAYGLGNTPETARMVWVNHFNLLPAQ